MKKFLVTTFALAAIALMATPAFAATATAPLTLSATVINNCTISTTPVAFGNYDPLSAAVNNASGTVVIACTKNAPLVTITLLNGNNFVVTRRMTDGTNFMDYEIYQPPSTVAGAACTWVTPQRWGTAGAEIFTPTAPPTMAARTYNVCGQIAAGQDLAAAVFNDTVTATVNF